MKKLLFPFLIILTLFLPAVAHAQHRSWKDGALHFVLEPRVGAFFPLDDVLKDRYDPGTIFAGLRVGVMLESNRLKIWRRHTLPGTLTFSIEGGWAQDTGYEVLAPQPRLRLYLQPNTATLEYALRFKEEQMIVPYVAGGFAGAYFREKVELPVPVITDGVRFGWVGEGGLRILLDSFDRAAAVGLHESTGISNTWIGFRGRYLSIAGFDQGIDLSGISVDGSLIFEF